MTNYITIHPTEFFDVRTGEKSLGFRVYDDYASSYCNICESLPDDDLEFISMVLEYADDNIRIMLDHVREHELGIFVGDEFYEWEQIKHLF